MYNNFFKRGISLIVLIITIVVIVILACAIILSVSKNNPVTNANKAVVQSDFKTLESELNMYISDELVSSMGDFNSILLYADSSSITYNGVQDTTKSITDILTTLKGTKYVDYVTIAGGKIIVSDSAPSTTKEWAEAVISPHTTCELKDASDEVKKAYKFSDISPQLSGYGYKILHKSGYEKNTIVYNDTLKTYAQLTLEIGYYRLTTHDFETNSYYTRDLGWSYTYLGENYQVTY
jgi:type II secretory pathway pseudopilin PulG